MESCPPGQKARTGLFTTPHGVVQTPAFMPVGTRASIKGVMPREVAEAGASMILANTLHLALRPGPEVVRKLGGLHRMMDWQGPILTDSGGYQVFSMADVNRIREDGVTFRSVVDGSAMHLTPERAIEIQCDLGADVIMAFDQCPADPLKRDDVAVATERTHRWLDRCVTRWQELGGLDRGQALFGIVQGGCFEDLRRASVAAVTSHDLVGYALGGISVGEGRAAIRDAFAFATPLLPVNKPRYLMGIGTPVDFFDAVAEGADLFDCVTPTRHGRNHQGFTSRGRVNLRNLAWALETGPLDPECPCPACTRYPAGALRHLCTVGEMLGGTLLSIHNLYFFHSLMARIRAAVAAGRLAELRAEVLPRVEQRFKPGAAEAE
ncbi:MAG: tRNA guanosine(34) transglycosylase Tgt [Planctomycetes bacterium]|nr:tRNA guanosine(34) transglycosylase Tgt [Planctomycetota bacterium]